MKKYLDILPLISENTYYFFRMQNVNFVWYLWL